MVEVWPTCHVTGDRSAAGQRLTGPSFLYPPVHPSCSFFLHKKKNTTKSNLGLSLSRPNPIYSLSRRHGPQVLRRWQLEMRAWSPPLLPLLLFDVVSRIIARVILLCWLFPHGYGLIGAEELFACLLCLWCLWIRRVIEFTSGFFFGSSMSIQIGVEMGLFLLRLSIFIWEWLDAAMR